MDNQQLYNFTREQLQVFLTSQLGDGTICTTNTNSTYYVTNCKYEEYIDFKINLLGNMFVNKKLLAKNGFANTPIWVMRSKSSDYLRSIRDLSIEEVIDNLDDLGVALWFYDDGSLHKSKLFYNLNTHKFSREVQENIFIPFFNKLEIYPKITKEEKRDGRIFYYLRIGKYDGAINISNILRKYYVDCYSYKIWSSETIQRWSKLQEELKSEAIDIKSIPNVALGRYDRNLISIEDIVRTYKKL